MAGPTEGKGSIAATLLAPQSCARKWNKVILEPPIRNEMRRSDEERNTDREKKKKS